MTQLLPTSQEEWEALPPEQLAKFSDLQLKKALKEFFGLRSHVYFMPVAAKREFILNPDERPVIQAAAEERQRAHQSAGATHKGKKPVRELIEERADGHSYEFVGVDRPTGGFSDPFNDRSGKIAYVIRDLADGSEFPTQKQTCKVLTELGRLAGFDERVSAKKQKPAHAAGFQTMEDVIAGGDPEVQEAASTVFSDEVEATTVVVDEEPDTEPLSDDREAALDDILNSIPQ